jgi:hypothetical protein
MKTLALIASLLGASQLVASAATITDQNVFNNSVQGQATVAVTDGYNTGVFPPSGIDDLAGPANPNEFYFADFQGVTPAPDHRLSLTGFDAHSGISAFNFFAGDNYENGRVATQVTIYYSTSPTTDGSLSTSDYVALNSGNPYTLGRTTDYSNNSYLNLDTTSGITYDTLLVDIPGGTRSILFDFGTSQLSNGDGTGYQVGEGFAEIQAIAAVPEPSTWAMMFAGLAFLGFCIRRKSKMTSASLGVAGCLFAASQMNASAQIISTPNIFNDGTDPAALVTVDSDYSYGSFPTSNVDNLSAGGQFVFGDYHRNGSTTNPVVNDQLMSISGFSDPTGIGSLRFFDLNQYEVGRVATQVTLFYTKATLTGAAALNPANYLVLNGGAAYSLPTDLNSNNGYTGGTDAASGVNYDTLTGLSVPTGTKGILLDFGAERDAYNGNTYFVGSGFQEIQAFGDAVVVPEPSTWAMMIGGLAFLGLCIRRKSASTKV